jgi:hypothetical protein
MKNKWVRGKNQPAQNPPKPTHFFQTLPFFSNPPIILFVVVAMVPKKKMWSQKI